MTELHEILSVQETSVPGVYVAKVDVTDMYGLRDIVDYTTYPTDADGISKTVRQAVDAWLESGGSPEPYTPPPPATPEQLRAAMPSLSARQLRLGLIANGITLASVQAAIDAISDPAAREVAQIEWEYSDKVERTHTLISQIGTALSLTPEQVDTMWEAASVL